MNEEINERSYITYLIYGILFANDLVCDEITIAYHQLKKSKLYRHQVKQVANKLLNECHHYKRYVTRVVGKQNIDFLADANDIYNEDIERHIEILKVTISSILLSRGVDDCDTIAPWVMINNLCQIADAKVYASDEAIKKTKMSRKTFLPLSIKPIRRHVDRLCELIYTGESIDLTQNKNYNLAVKIIEKKCSDPDIITRAICDRHTNDK